MNEHDSELFKFFLAGGFNWDLSVGGGDGGGFSWGGSTVGYDGGSSFGGGGGHEDGGFVGGSSFGGGARGRGDPEKTAFVKGFDRDQDEETVSLQCRSELSTNSLCYQSRYLNASFTEAIRTGQLTHSVLQIRDTLKKHFMDCGVSNVRIPTDRDSGAIKGSVETFRSISGMSSDDLIYQKFTLVKHFRFTPALPLLSLLVLFPTLRP